VIRRISALTQRGVSRLRLRVENKAPLHMSVHNQTGDNHNGQRGTAEHESEDTESATVGHWSALSPFPASDDLREYVPTRPKVRGVAHFFTAAFAAAEVPVRGHSHRRARSNR